MAVCKVGQEKKSLNELYRLDARQSNHMLSLHVMDFVTQAHPPWHLFCFIYAFYLFILVKHYPKGIKNNLCGLITIRLRVMKSLLKMFEGLFYFIAKLYVTSLTS